MLSEKLVYMRSKEKIVDNSIWFHVTGFDDSSSDDDWLFSVVCLVSYAVVEVAEGGL